MHDTDLVFELIVSAVRLARDRASRGDLKMANAALKEMRYAFTVFEPYRSARKAAIFGSARTTPRRSAVRSRPSRIARELADGRLDGHHRRRPRDHGGRHRRRGRGQLFGVSIRLPFEAATTQFLADDPKLVNFRYFFTRKVTFVKEAHAFVLLPGRLRHARRGVRAAHARADRQGGARADRAARRSRRHVLAELDAVRASTSCGTGGYISPDDLELVLITDDVHVALAEITGFYRNYHSLRFVDGDLVLRMQHAARPTRRSPRSTTTSPTSSRAAGSSRSPTSKAEIADHDVPDLARLRMRFDRHSYARLHVLIKRLNDAG